MGTEGSASNCQKQDGDLVAHVYNEDIGTIEAPKDASLLHFFLIEAPFGEDPHNVDAAFVLDCEKDKASPGRCIDYTDAHKKLRELAFSKNHEPPTEKVDFQATLYQMQIIKGSAKDKMDVGLTSDETRSYPVRVPRAKQALTDQEKKRLEVRTTLTHAGDRDHENDEWRLVEVDLGPAAAKQGDSASTPEWTNLCGRGRLAMVMFGRVHTDYLHSWSPLRLDMVLRLKPGTQWIDTTKLDMVIACETAMTAKCAYEHGYRPWAKLKDQYGRTVPPEDLAALLSTCSLASTQCTKTGNHIVVIDDLGMNRPYPLDYGKRYFDYEGTFRYGDGTGPHRERVCHLREKDASPRCKAHYDHLELNQCEIEDERKYNYTEVRTFTYLDQLLEKKISYADAELLITDDGRWYAGRVTGLTYNGARPPFGISERRVMIWSKPGAPHPTRPAAALPDQVAMDVAHMMELPPGHIYTMHRNISSKDTAEKYFKDLPDNPFDDVTCTSNGLSVACFMYRSKRGSVTFTPSPGVPNRIYRYHEPT